MKKGALKISFNNEVVKGMKKDEFLKAFEHHAKDVNLGAEYDRITGKQPKEG